MRYPDYVEPLGEARGILVMAGKQLLNAVLTLIRIVYVCLSWNRSMGVDVCFIQRWC